MGNPFTSNTSTRKWLLPWKNSYNVPFILFRNRKWKVVRTEHMPLSDVNRAFVSQESHYQLFSSKNLAKYIEKIYWKDSRSQSDSLMDSKEDSVSLYPKETVQYYTMVQWDDLPQLKPAGNTKEQNLNGKLGWVGPDLFHNHAQMNYSNMSFTFCSMC